MVVRTQACEDGHVWLEGIRAVSGPQGAPGTQPAVLVIGESRESEAIRTLLARRGFLVTLTSSCAAVECLVDDGALPRIAIIDFAHPDAWHAQGLVDSAKPRPGLVGICSTEDKHIVEIFVDEVVVRPLHTAHVHQLVVGMISEETRSPGLALGSVRDVITGNELFVQIISELEAILPKHNPGLALAGVLQGLRSSPSELTGEGLLAMIDGGGLAEALGLMATKPDIDAAIHRLVLLLRERRPSPA